MLFSLNAKQRKVPVVQRARLSPHASADMTPAQIDAWCSRVEDARQGDPDLSDATHLYNLGLDPHSKIAAQVLDALAER